MNARDVIVAPRITEKAMADALVQQYTFVVHPQATKTQIRHAVEEIFKVNVLAVNTVNVRGKSRTFARKGRRTTRTAERLQEGHRDHQAGSEDRARRRQLLRAIRACAPLKNIARLPPVSAS